MLRFWTCVCVSLFLSFNSIHCQPISSRRRPYVVEFESERMQCNEMDSFKWAGDFHECFIDKKYNDGGRDLNNIVDRILEHSEACVKNSSRECQPDFDGFKWVMKKVIEQIKDYSEMYLELIHKGRENIKDLYCVEEKLSVRTYETCFDSLRNSSLAFNKLQKITKEGLSCATRANWGCSKKAKIVLNRIVRILLGIEQPSEEDVGDDIRTTPASKVLAPNFARSPPPPPPPKPTPAPWQWYDYIIQPFITAWNAISNFFG